MIRFILISLGFLLSTNVFASSGNNQIVIHPFVFSVGHSKQFQFKVDSSKAIGAFSFPKLGLTIVGFQARSNDNVQVPVSFMILGHMASGNKFIPLQYVSGNDYFYKIELFDLDGDGTGEVFFWQGGGAHHMDLSVYKIKNNRLKLIFDGGSAEGLEVVDEVEGLSIRIYRDKFDVPGWSEADPTDRYEVWGWKDHKFEFDKKLSTVKSPYKIGEESQRYLNKYNSL